MAKKSTSNKKRLVKVEAVGQAHVHSSFNNIIISLTNSSGQVISWSSAGKMGFRGSKKNTPYAAQTAATDCGKVAFELRYMSKDRVTVENQQFVQSTLAELKLPRSLMLRHFRTMDVVLPNGEECKLTLGVIFKIK